MPAPREPTPQRGARPVVGGAAPEGARRRFLDRRGTAWEVHEERIPVEEWTSADAEAHESGYGVGWLIFAGVAW
jgi:hypothetical protein